MQNLLTPKNAQHKFSFDDAVAEELAFIGDEIFKGNKQKFMEMFDRLTTALKHVDKHWRNNSKEMTKPKLSTYGYRSHKFFSSKALENKPNESPDFRVIFKYQEETNTLYFLTVGIRVDKNNNTYLPKDQDVYARVKERTLPEEV